VEQRVAGKDFASPPSPARCLPGVAEKKAAGEKLQTAGNCKQRDGRLSRHLHNAILLLWEQ